MFPHRSWVFTISQRQHEGGLVRHSKKVARVAQRIGDPYGSTNFPMTLSSQGSFTDSSIRIDGEIPKITIMQRSRDVVRTKQHL